jgi:hypothetical protein
MEMATSVSEVFYDDGSVEELWAKIFFNNNTNLLKKIYIHAILEKGASLYCVENRYKKMVQSILDTEGVVIIVLYHHKIVVFYDGTTDWIVARQSIIQAVIEALGEMNAAVVSFRKEAELPPSHVSGPEFDRVPCGITTFAARKRHGPAFLANCVLCSRKSDPSVMQLARNITGRGPYAREAEFAMPLPQLNGGNLQILAAGRKTSISVRSGRRKRRKRQVMLRKNCNEG